MADILKQWWCNCSWQIGMGGLTYFHFHMNNFWCISTNLAIINDTSVPWKPGFVSPGSEGLGVERECGFLHLQSNSSVFFANGCHRNADPVVQCVWQEEPSNVFWVTSSLLMFSDILLNGPMFRDLSSWVYTMLVLANLQITQITYLEMYSI